MNDRKKDESIIDLTEVVEEAPSHPPGGAWMESPPAPGPEKKAAEAAPEPKGSEPPNIPRKDSPVIMDDLKDIPESPLKKFLLAEDEPTGQFPPPPPPAVPPTDRPTGSPPAPTQASRPATEPPKLFPPTPRIPPEPPRKFHEPVRTAPEPSRPAPEPSRLAPEPPKIPAPDMEAEMRAIREAMMSRVEKWVAQEGAQILERVAREVFPKVAGEIIREEIEKLKKEAEDRS
jgi:hypothetical protein